MKPSQGKLEAKYGQDRARAIRHEGENALEWIEEFIKTEGIDCSLKDVVDFMLPIHRAVQYSCKRCQKLSKQEDIPVEIVSKQDQRKELGTDLYNGGVIFPDMPP